MMIHIEPSNFFCWVFRGFVPGRNMAFTDQNWTWQHVLNHLHDICVIHNVAIVLHIHIYIYIHTYIYILCINQFITPAEDLAFWSTCINVRHCSTITQRNQEENLNLKSATSLPNQKERTSPTTNQPLWLDIHIPKLQSANRNQPSPSWSGQILCNVQGSSLHRSDKPQLHVTGTTTRRWNWTYYSLDAWKFHNPRRMYTS